MNAAMKTASIIRTYNAALADCYIRQPFRRVDLAYAFAAGFATNQYGDLPSCCYEVIRLALADRESGKSMIGK